MADLLYPVAIVFVTAATFLLIATRLPIPAIPVYIVVGLAIGPTIEQGATLELAQWGIAFLVFAFGVEVEPTRFKTVATDSEFVAAVQLLVVGSIAAGFGLGLGLSPIDAVFVGTTAALSSSLVGRELVITDIRRDLLYGRLIASIHFVHELIAVLLILVLSAAMFTPDGIALKLGYGVIILLAAIVVRVYLYRPLVHLSGKSDELVVLTGIGLLLGFISLSVAADVAIAVGAFAAGVAIPREHPDSLALITGLESFDDFFAAIFFVTLGSLVSVPTPRVLLLAAVGFIAVAVLRPLVTSGLLLWRGYEPRTALMTSFGLDQVSEFALIIAIQAFLIGRIELAVFEAIILTAAATMITSTFTRRYEQSLSRRVINLAPSWLSRRWVDERSQVDGPLDDHVIVVGWGQLGRIVTRTCDDLGLSVVVIEHDPERLEDLRDADTRYVFADAMSRVAWKRAGAENASLVVSTVPQRGLSERILTLDILADVFVRASDPAEALALYDRGATYVILPDGLAGESLVEKLKDALSGHIPLEEFRDLNWDELIAATDGIVD
jgi:CPA2 family monovalent cation:H+ antiporter-2